MTRLRKEYSWIICKNCGHKLLKLTDGGSIEIETKCHSCKAINQIVVKSQEELV